jgi:PAS domain S-box-containing protein
VDEDQATLMLSNDDTILHHILNAIPTPVSYVDTSYIFQYANNAFIKYFSKQKDQLIGYSVEEFFKTTIFNENIKPRLDQCFAGKMVEQVDWYPVPDNEEKYLKVQYIPYRNKKNQVIGSVIQVNDITTLKESQDILLEQKQKAEKYLQLAGTMLLTLDADGTIILLNKKGCQILGYDEEELIGKNWFEHCIPSESINEIRDVFQKVIDGKKDVVTFHENFVVRKDGTKRLILWYNTVLKDGVGNVVGVLSSGEDITEKKKVEGKLRESEETFRSIINSSPMGIIMYHLDEHDRLVFAGANPAFEKILGITNSQYIGKTLEEAFPPLAQTEVPYRYQRAALFGESWFSDQIDYDYGGVTGSYEVYAFQMSPRKAAVFFSDITARKKTEEKIRNLSSIVEQSIEGIIIADLQGIITYANDAWYHMHGYTKEDQLIGKNQEMFHTREQLEKEVKPFTEHVQQCGKCNSEVGHVTKDGVTFQTFMSTTLLKNQNNKPIAMACIANDISELVDARNQIQNDEIFLTDVFDSISDGLSVLDKDLTVIRTNKFMEEMYRHKMPLMGKKCYEIYQDRTSICSWCPSIKAMQSKKSQSTIVPYPNSTHPKGWIHLSAYPLIDSKGKVSGVIECAKDITNQKKAEEELKQAHKLLLSMNEELESKILERTADVEQLLTQKDNFINQLGHDLKNPLGPLLQLLPVLKKQEKNQERIELYEVMIRNVKYMKNLVFKTVELARLNSPETHFVFSPINVKDEVHEIIEDNKLLFDNNKITVETDIPQTLPKVQADKIHLQELLTNLINNAVKYSKGPGTITIQAQPNDDVVIISVKDTGIGMSKDHISHLFEEFYKADESRHDFNSSGLGMAICKRIVDRHGGKIWVESEGVGKGTTVYFTLKTEPQIPDEELVNDNLAIKKPSRFQFIKHKGKEILYLNYAYLPEDEYGVSYQEIEDFIVESGKRNLLLLINVEGNYFNIEQVRNTKKIGSIVGPYLKKNAIMGLSKNQEIFLKAIRLFSGINIKPFRNMDDAKNWLVQ